MGPPMYTVSGQLAHLDKKNNVANDATDNRNNVDNDAIENGDNDSDEVMEEAVAGKRTRSNGANGGPEAKRGRV